MTRITTFRAPQPGRARWITSSGMTRAWTVKPVVAEPGRARPGKPMQSRIAAVAAAWGLATALAVLPGAAASMPVMVNSFSTFSDLVSDSSHAVHNATLLGNDRPTTLGLTYDGDAYRQLWLETDGSLRMGSFYTFSDLVSGSQHSVHNMSLLGNDRPTTLALTYDGGSYRQLWLETDGRVKMSSFSTFSNLVSGAQHSVHNLSLLGNDRPTTLALTHDGSSYRQMWLETDGRVKMSSFSTISDLISGSQHSVHNMSLLGNDRPGTLGLLRDDSSYRQMWTTPAAVPEPGLSTLALIGSIIMGGSATRPRRADRRRRG